MADFFTRVKFINRHSSLYQESYRKDELDVLDSKRQWAMEKLSDYFNPFSKRVFIIHGYCRKTHSLVGYEHDSYQPSIVSTILKIVSYFTIILPILAFAGILVLNASINYITKHGERKKAAWKIISVIRRHLYKKTKRPEASASLYINTILQGSRIAGEIFIANHRLWTSYKPIAGQSNKAMLIVKPLDGKTKEELAPIAVARLSYDDTNLCATLSDVQIHLHHPYLQINTSGDLPSFSKFDEAPEILDPVLEPLGKAIFYAAVRYISNKTHNEKISEKLPMETALSAAPSLHHKSTESLPPTSLFSSPNYKYLTEQPRIPSINVVGDFANLLTRDGPNRVVSDDYLQPALGAMPASINAPIHLYEQSAFQQLLLPTTSKNFSKASLLPTAQPIMGNSNTALADTTLSPGTTLDQRDATQAFKNKHSPSQTVSRILPKAVDSSALPNPVFTTPHKLSDSMPRTHSLSLLGAKKDSKLNTVSSPQSVV